MNAITNALTTLFISIPAFGDLHPLTLAAKAADPRVATWLSGQLWAWEGGDAMTVLTGGLYPDQITYFVIREGDKVEIVEAQSISKALEERGYRVKVAHPE